MLSNIQGMVQKIQGWLGVVNWQDTHYGLAFIGTIILFVTYITTRKVDTIYAGFISGMWITAVGNDRVNTPPVIAS